MKLNEFIEEVQERIAEFKADWEDHKDDPNWPDEMDLPDWFEQFMFFLQSRRNND